MTANDSDVSDGDTLTGSQVVRVYGENLTAPFVTLTFGDVEYTPLIQGEDYIGFILTDNGTAIIAVDGSRFMSFEVDGITTPQDLSGNVRAWLASRTNAILSGSALDTNDGCLNYARMVTADYPRLRVDLTFNDTPEITESDITPVNGTIEYFNIRAESNVVIVVVQPTDPTKVCYLIYEDFIYFVGNYTTD